MKNEEKVEKGDPSELRISFRDIFFTVVPVKTIEIELFLPIDFDNIQAGEIFGDLGCDLRHEPADLFKHGIDEFLQKKDQSDDKGERIDDKHGHGSIGPEHDDPHKKKHEARSQGRSQRKTGPFQHPPPHGSPVFPGRRR